MVCQSVGRRTCDVHSPAGGGGSLPSSATGCGGGGLTACARALCSSVRRESGSTLGGRLRATRLPAQARPEGVHGRGVGGPSGVHAVATCHASHVPARLRHAPSSPPPGCTPASTHAGRPTGSPHHRLPLLTHVHRRPAFALEDGGGGQGGGGALGRHPRPANRRALCLAGTLSAHPPLQSTAGKASAAVQIVGQQSGAGSQRLGASAHLHLVGTLTLTCM